MALSHYGNFTSLLIAVAAFERQVCLKHGALNFEFGDYK